MIIASRLLALDRKEGTTAGAKFHLYPIFAALLNLIFCGYMDQFLQSDPDGYYLSLFLFIQSSFLVFISTGNFIRGGQEILMKTTIFPTTPLSRMLFVLSSNVKHPLSFVLLATNVLFMIVVYHSSAGVIIGVVSFFLLTVLAVEIVVSAASLVLAKRSRPMIGVIMGGVGLLGIVLVFSVVFQATTLLTSMPVIAWATGGIIALQSGDSVMVWRDIGYLCVTCAVIFLAGRRYG